MTILALKEIIKTEKVKGGRYGRSDYGRLHTFADGTKIYLAKRTQKEIFCQGEKNLSDAIRLGKAEWALDDETIMTLTVNAVKLVGIIENDDGDIWLTTLEDWYDSTKYAYRNYSSRGGALQRYMNLSHFRRASGCKHLTTKLLDKKQKALGRFVP